MTPYHRTAFVVQISLNCGVLKFADIALLVAAICGFLRQLLSLSAGTDTWQTYLLMVVWVAVGVSVLVLARVRSRRT